MRGQSNQSNIPNNVRFPWHDPSRNRSSQTAPWTNDLSHICNGKSLLDCSVEVIDTILRFLDQYTLFKVAATCKALQKIAYPLILACFPVVSAVPVTTLHFSFHERLTEISRWKAALVQHLFLDPNTNVRDPQIRESLGKFVNLQSLTLYTIGSWDTWHVDKYLGAPFLSVPDLTLRIHPVKHCDPMHFNSNDSSGAVIEAHSIKGWLNYLLQNV